MYLERPPKKASNGMVKSLEANVLKALWKFQCAISE